ncbi:hypothetical protein [Bradyrhizobium genosp. A]
MAELQALRSAVAAAEKKSGFLPHNDNFAQSSANANSLNSRGRGRTFS